MPEIISCRACGKETYAEVPKCPHCGEIFEWNPQPEQDVSISIGVGSVISRSLKILFRNIFPFMVLALLVTSPSFLFEVFVLPNLDANQAVGFGAIAGLLGWMLSFVLTGALTYGTFMEMKGEKARFGDVVTKGISMIIPVLGVAIISQILVMIGMVMLIIPGIIASLMLFVAVPVSVIEKTTVQQSLVRSVDLTKGNRWQILGIYLLTALLSFVIILVPAIIIVFAIGTLGGETIQASQIGNYLGGAFGGAYFAVVIAVTYHDLRVAKEGLDTDQLAAVFD